MRVFNWAAVEEERLSEQIVRKMFWGENIMVTKWELAPNINLPTHDHVSEQVTTVERGSVTITFPEGGDVTLHVGDMLVIPPSKPHGVKVGPEGCTAVDLFSPIRRDFIEKSSAYLGQTGPGKGDQTPPAEDARHAEAYVSLQRCLATKGINVGMEQVKEVPLELLARYAYERECISMGQVRAILGMDKEQAKALVRQWKHGDDHSEASLRRKLERLVSVVGGTPPHSGR
jgi:quercetin dioxygenase-like cupin family protein